MPDLGDTLDLSVLDAGSPDHVIAYARGASDLAIAKVPINGISILTAFSRQFDDFARGRLTQLTQKDVEAYGHALFDFAIRDDVRKLYDRLPATHVRINVLSNRPEVQSLPWEFLIEPNQMSAPRRERSIVRVVPTVGVTPDRPRSFSDKTRILFVSADPADQTAVSWPDVQASIENTFQEQLPDRFALSAHDGATLASFVEAIQSGPFDIFHFSGHGVVRKGEGNLVLTGRGRKSAYLPASKLIALLGGRGVRLIVLSACDTAAGNFGDGFAVIAEALVRRGIPAVIANQVPVKDNTVAVFVGAVYEQLLQSGDIDLAVGEGRLSLFADLESQESGERAAVEWGIPTLYRHVAAAQVFLP
jgi:hypothetical protein